MNLSKLNLIMKKKLEWRRKINNIQIWGKRYRKNYIAKFNQYHYKIKHNETNLVVLFYELPYLINSVINEEYIVWLEEADVVNILKRISYSR